MMDRNSPESLQEVTEDSMRSSVRLFEKWDGAEGGRLRYVFTPRFAGSCSMELMKEVGRIARERNAHMSRLISVRTAMRWNGCGSALSGIPNVYRHLLGCRTPRRTIDHGALHTSF